MLHTGEESEKSQNVKLQQSITLQEIGNKIESWMDILQNLRKA